MVNWWEPEEVIGGIWHRFVGDRSSYPSYADAAVSFDEIATFLPILFRTIGGRKSVKFTASGATLQEHRLGFLQRLGTPQEAIKVSRATSELIALPDSIDVFPDTNLNRDLYIWLAIFFASADQHQGHEPDDPLAKDLHFIRLSYYTTLKAHTFYKGFIERYDALASAMLIARGERDLPPVEREMEDLIKSLLGDRSSDIETGHPFFDYVVHGIPLPPKLKAPRNYRPALALPLWGEICPSRSPNHYTPDDGELSEQGPDDDEEQQSITKKARRENFDQADRDDPLILYPFEGLMSWAEMLNIARTVEDDDEENAKKAANEADEIVLTPNKKRAATKIKVELDLPANSIETASIEGEILYKEWDYQINAYRPDFCNVIATVAALEDKSPAHTRETKRMIKRVRRQFESLRPKREILRRQLDGSELDMDAVIRAHCDLAACGQGSDNIYMASRDQARDLSVAILVDASLSTDAWIENRRILDVEKETLAVMAHGLEACGDHFALFSFTSRKRDHVYVSTLKDFDERMSEKVDRRMAAMKPGHYTRIGAALRHVSAQLDKQPTRHRLLLVITDGKPNDIDHYEGKYGVEDTRMAIREARRMGQTVYGVTIDKQARDYFPHMFGKGAYSIVSHLGKLPSALPMIYRNVTS